VRYDAAHDSRRSIFNSRCLRNNDVQTVVVPKNDKRLDPRIRDSALGDAVASELKNLPEGWSADTERKSIVLRGPYSKDLQQRLHRIGQWDRGKSCWIVPADKRTSLQRVLTNSAKATVGQPSPLEMERARAEVRRVSDLVRWLGYVESSAKEGRVYEHGIAQCRYLGIDKHPEMADRLSAAIETAKAGDEKRRAQWAAERAAETAARRAQRCLYPLSTLPRVGATMRVGKRVVVIESYGQAFRITEDHPSMHGAHLLGHEGRFGAYAYYREATAEEVAAFEQREAAAAAAAQAHASRQAEIQSIIAVVRVLDNLLPASSPEPTGQIIIDTRDAYGGGYVLRVDDSGVTYVQGNSADGDDWSASNVPCGIAWRSSEPDLQARARRLTDKANG
jgi:hypothetical protein